MVKSVVLLQVSSAVFSFPMYFYKFFLLYAALFHFFCSISLIYKGEGRNEERQHTASSVLLRKMYHREE